MIEHTLDEAASLLHVRPTGPLREEDFDTLARTVDPFIERTGGLGGLILEIAHFPGWESLGAAIRHFRFVRDHHRKVRRVAIVTDSPIGDVAERVTSHFVSAEIRHFPSTGLADARAWLARAGS